MNAAGHPIDAGIREGACEVRYTLNGLASERTSCSFLVAVLIAKDQPPPTELVLRVAETDQALDTAWYRYGDGGHVAWVIKPRFENLEPGTSYDASLRSSTGEEVATARVTTLPGADHTGPVTLVSSSCFAEAGSAHGSLTETFEELRRGHTEGDRLAYQFWAGDQVYVDAPWSDGLKASLPSEVILGKYASVWGLTNSPAPFAEIMRASSNWYLPDDHEFWNGYPHPSVTLLRHTATRLLVQAWRRVRPGKNLPHPFAQGAWGRAAGDAYCTFQSAAAMERFDEDVSPPQVQLVDLAHVLVVMADTRWRRTIRKSSGTAGFMAKDDLELVVSELGREERPVCLILSKPLIGHLPKLGFFRGKIEYGPEDFDEQYRRLWTALQDRAQSNCPTIVVGGDIHLQALHGALDDRLLQIASSPLALLEDLATGFVPVARTAWSANKALIRVVADKVTRRRRSDAQGLRYPIVDPSDRWGEPVAASVFEPACVPTNALAELSFEKADDGGPLLAVRLARTVAGQISSSDHRFAWIDNRWTQQSPSEPV